MKSIYLTAIALLFFAGAYSQEAKKADSTKANPSVLALKKYLDMRTLPSAVMREQDIQGLAIVGFKIDSTKKITAIQFLKPSTKEYNERVTRVLTEYTKDVLLPPGEYSIAFEFLLLHGKPEIETLPFDKSVYPNFLFEVDVIYNN